jgi:predicted glycosyltransferase
MSSPANPIWIDLDNSPHVLFFAPIIRELKTRRYNVALTVRDCFQVCGLADLHSMSYSRVGRHYGGNKILKATGTIWRSFQLSLSVLRLKPCLALSHGSRSQLFASKMLRIPSVVIGDYEHAKGLPLIFPDVLIVPELITNDLHWHSERVEKYPGIKEDVYVPDFAPDERILGELGLNGENIVVTIRPPATEAHYHNPESEALFTEVVNFLGSKTNLRMVILPRNEKKQGDLIRSKWANWCHERKIIIPEKVVDGLNLIWHSDLVVSGGGTMNREAAALGVPVYSIFRGRIGAVDRYLARVGRLTLIESAEDVRNKILAVPREKTQGRDHSDKTTLMRVVEIIEDSIRNS